MIEHRTWIEVRTSALAHNVVALRSCLGSDVGIIAPVKANAYGHGLEHVARLLWNEGIRFFGVDAVDEAVAVRACLPTADTLILGFVPDKDLCRVVDGRFHMGLYDLEQAAILEELAAAKSMRVPLHIKIETGTARQGIFPDDLPRFVAALVPLSHLDVVGVYTHLARAEEPNHPFTKMQVDMLYGAVGRVADQLPQLTYVHAANTAAVLTAPFSHGTVVRPGLGLYGYWPADELEKQVRAKKPALTLEPVLSWHTQIAQLKDYGAGTPIGYDGTEVLNRPARVAVVPVGYYDGYSRGLSSKGEVLIRGQRCRVLGRVCMNMMMVDASRVPSPKRGELVTLLGVSGAERVWADELAVRAGTIAWEILARLSQHLPRVLVP